MGSTGQEEGWLAINNVPITLGIFLGQGFG